MIACGDADTIQVSLPASACILSSPRDSGRTRSTSLGSTVGPLHRAPATEAPSTLANKRIRTSSDRSSVAPTMRKASASEVAPTISEVGTTPARHASTAKTNTDEPLMRVRSRSKKAAAAAGSLTLDRLPSAHRSRVGHPTPRSVRGSPSALSIRSSSESRSVGAVGCQGMVASGDR